MGLVLTITWECEHEHDKMYARAIGEIARQKLTNAKIRDSGPGYILVSIRGVSDLNRSQITDELIQFAQYIEKDVLMGVEGFTWAVEELETGY